MNILVTESPHMTHDRCPHTESILILADLQQTNIDAVHSIVSEIHMFMDS